MDGGHRGHLRILPTADRIVRKDFACWLLLSKDLEKNHRLSSKSGVAENLKVHRDWLLKKDFISSFLKSGREGEREEEKH